MVFRILLPPTVWFSYGFLWFSYGSMVFLWFSYGFPMVFLWFSYGFPMVFLWFSYGFPMVSMVLPRFPMVFLWFSYGFPMVFLWFHKHQFKGTLKNYLLETTYPRVSFLLRNYSCMFTNHPSQKHRNLV